VKACKILLLQGRVKDTIIFFVRISWLFVLLLTLGLVGCGGGGGGGGGTKTVPVTSGATFSVAWGDRSRSGTLTGVPSAALSAVVTLTGASQSGADVVQTVNRNATISAHTETYTVTTPIRQTSTPMTAKFYAQANGAGALVGTAQATVTLNGTAVNFANLVTSGTITKVTVAPVTITVGGAATQLAFSALDANSGVVAVTPGSAVWQVDTGSTFVTLTPDGMITGLGAGSATVHATVSGVSSAPTTITIGNAVTAGATFSVAWPARSRGTITGVPSAALSIVMTLPGASQSGSNIVQTFNRSSTIAAHTEAYTISTPMKATTTAMTAKFYANADGGGAVVGTAQANVTLTGTSVNFASLSTDSPIASVTVDPVTLPVGGAATQLDFAAFDATNNVVAVTPGSAIWKVDTGSTVISITPDGIVTPLKQGIATIHATVSGISSGPVTISVGTNITRVLHFSKPTDTIQLLGGTLNGACSISSAFTVEMIIRPNVATNTSLWQQFTDGIMNECVVLYNGNLVGDITGSGKPDQRLTVTGIPLKQWIELAFVYDGQNFFLYQNGQLTQTLAVGPGSAPTAVADACAFGNNIAVDGLGAAPSFAGDVASFRISNVVRYTGNYTAKGLAYTSDASTLALLDPSSIVGTPTSFTLPGSQGLTGNMGAGAGNATSPTWQVYTP